MHCQLLILADDTSSNSGWLLALQVVPQPISSKSQDADDVEDGKDRHMKTKGSKGLHSYESAFQQLCLLLQP